MSKKLAILLCISFLIVHRIYSQGLISSILMHCDSGYTYYPGTAEPPSGWNQTSFNDETWLTGTGSIGFGDNDDSTTIGVVPSVYLRYKFRIDYKDGIRKVNAMVDYDDGFVAYLNGAEIIRVNMGKQGEYIPFNRVTDRSHEAFFYRNYFRPVCGYYIDTDTLAKYLRNGENVLAVQVHNDSIGGSDLSFQIALLEQSTGYWDLYWDEFRGIKQVNIDSTRLPIVMINTDEYGIPVPHVRYKAHMGIINATSHNRPSDPYTDYDGNISIEIRGKSSVDFPKKSYNVETQDATGNNLNVPLMGMPKENDWILYGPYTDKSLIRNEIAFTIARKFGRYQPRTRFCELIMNGENHGLYVLTEKIKRDSCRVNISKLKDTDISGTDLTGGYLFDLEGGYLGIRYPEDNDILPVQLDYITGFYNDFLAVLNSPDFMDPVKGYKKYIDDQSLIDYIIVNEAIKNCDSYMLSDFAYKDRDDKGGRIVYGPLWDNDLAFGNSTFQNGHLTTGWQFEENPYLHFTEIMHDRSFVQQLSVKWDDLRETGFLRTDSLMHLIDSLVNYIADARVRNYEIWPMIDKSLFYQYYPYVSENYGQEIQILKNYFNERLDWVDKNISYLYYPLPNTIADTPYASDFIIYPNPFTGPINIAFLPADSAQYTIAIYDVTGRMIHFEEHNIPYSGPLEITLNGEFILPAKGIYILVIRENGSIVCKRKLIKA